MQVALGKEYAASLRMVADFYEAHPELKLPYTQSYDGKTFWVTLDTSEREQLREFARAFGTFTKHADSTGFKLLKSFGTLALQVEISRGSVCTPEVIGKRTVTRKVPIGFREEIVEEDIIEWKCPGSILKLDTSAPTIEAPVQAVAFDDMEIPF